MNDIELIESKIYWIRGQKVMLDRDLAVLYKIETRTLNQAVKRNKNRFPEDFMFELTEKEEDSLRSQFVISKGRGGKRYRSSAFTEHGIVMLASVLRSDVAVQMSVRIVRVFVEMKRIINQNKDILLKLQEMENRLLEHDDSIHQLMHYLKQFIKNQNVPKKRIGFK